MGLSEDINRLDDQDSEDVLAAWNRIAEADPQLRKDLGTVIGSLSRSITTVMARLAELARHVEALEEHT
jgi:hypothetical protein